MQMILAEQTAMQASTVGSSLMFSRQTCRGNTAGQSVNQCRPYDPDHVCGQCSFSLQVHYDNDTIETQFSSPVLHIHHCYTPTLHNRCQGSCGWGRHRKTAGEKILFFKIKAQKCVHKLNTKGSSCYSHLHAAPCLHYRNCLQKLRVPLVLVHC